MITVLNGRIGHVRNRQTPETGPQNQANARNCPAKTGERPKTPQSKNRRTPEFSER